MQNMIYSKRSYHQDTKDLADKAHQLFIEIVELDQQLKDLEQNRKSRMEKNELFTTKYNETKNNKQFSFEAKLSEDRQKFEKQSSNDEAEFQQHQLEESCRIATLTDEITKISAKLNQLKQKVDVASTNQTTKAPSSTASQYTIFLNDYR